MRMATLKRMIDQIRREQIQRDIDFAVAEGLLPLPPRICNNPSCYGEFEPDRRDKRYCSKRCSRSSWRRTPLGKQRASEQQAAEAGSPER